MLTRGSDDIADVTLDSTSAGGAATDIPGALAGVGAMNLRASGDASFTIESWRFRRVSPAGTAIRYSIRRFPPPGERSCPGGHVGFGFDGPEARATGDVFPCDMHVPTGRDVVDARQGWELIGVFWNGERPGTVTRVADVEVVLRDGDGRRRTRTLDIAHEYCAIGDETCVSFLADSDGDEEDDGAITRRQAVRKLRLICHAPHRQPLFAPPASRPPVPTGVVRARDESGRPCSRPAQG